MGTISVVVDQNTFGYDTAIGANGECGKVVISNFANDPLIIEDDVDTFIFDLTNVKMQGRISGVIGISYCVFDSNVDTADEMYFEFENGAVYPVPTFGGESFYIPVVGGSSNVIKLRAGIPGGASTIFNPFAAQVRFHDVPLAPFST